MHMMPGGRYNTHYHSLLPYQPTYLALYQITDYFVVEIINGSPFNSLRHILLLLCFKCEFYKYLLQFLIHKVYTELLKAIFLCTKKTQARVKSKYT